jgi:predicted dehydrogenase
MTGPPSLPDSGVPDPRDAPPLRWGILGAGWIAERFVRALHDRTRQQVVSVGARSADAAASFAHRFGIARGVGGYEALVGDPDVDVVYVATTHQVHLAHAGLALQAGKHVLVEKPIAVDADEAIRLAGTAAAAQRFCMEAMWTLFLPRYDVIRQVLGDGMLGELKTVLADFGEHFAADHRIMRQELAGGPMLDLGTYPVALALWVLGEPTGVLASGSRAPSGVNGQTGMLLTHQDGQQSVLHTSLFSNTPTVAVIAGTAGVLTVEGPFYAPGPFRIDFADGRPSLRYEEIRSGYDGLAYEAAACARCIVAGQTESPVRPLAQSVATLRVMDRARDQLQVR